MAVTFSQGGTVTTSNATATTNITLATPPSQAIVIAVVNLNVSSVSVTQVRASGLFNLTKIDDNLSLNNTGKQSVFAARLGSADLTSLALTLSAATKCIMNWAVFNGSEITTLADAITLYGNTATGTAATTNLTLLTGTALYASTVTVPAQTGTVTNITAITNTATTGGGGTNIRALSGHDETPGQLVRGWNLGGSTTWLQSAVVLNAPTVSQVARRKYSIV